MPFAGYKDFKDCVRKNNSRKDPEAYCAVIMRKAEALPEKTLEIRSYDVFDVQEAEFDDENMEAKITILREGRSKNRRNYSKRVLREAVSSGIFDNIRMFVDHSDKPPVKRSLKELVSATQKTSYEEDALGGKITAPVKFFSKDFFEFAKKAKDFMGDSISAHLRVARYHQPDGTVFEDVQKIMKGYSVDWVVFPAAGGGIENFVHEAEGDNSVAAVEWAEITEDMLKENAPDLYQRLTVHEDDGDDDDDKDKDGDDDKESVLTLSAVEAIVERKVAEAQTEWNAKQDKQREDASKVADLVDSTPLPATTKARLKKSFDGQDFVESKVKEAIEEAKAELKEAGAGPKVTGMGVTAPQSSTKKIAGKAEEAVAAIFGYKPAVEAEKN